MGGVPLSPPHSLWAMKCEGNIAEQVVTNWQLVTIRNLVTIRQLVTPPIHPDTLTIIAGELTLRITAGQLQRKLVTFSFLAKIVSYYPFMFANCVGGFCGH